MGRRLASGPMFVGKKSKIQSIYAKSMQVADDAS